MPPINANVEAYLRGIYLDLCKSWTRRHRPSVPTWPAWLADCQAKGEAVRLSKTGK